MNTMRGRLLAQLELGSQPDTNSLIPLLNQHIHPPTPLSESDLYIRAMHIVSDQINAYGGRFPVDEHPRLTELLVDSPVLIGHRRDLLPIGRTFHATTVERDGVQWVKSYFYWLRSAEGSDTLRDNIDAGIYKECSIGFVYGLPECSICGKDIRLCPHEPMQSYGDHDGSSLCHFNYRQIDRVLETSLVYRGAIPDTSITRDLAITKSDSHTPIHLMALSDLPAADRYLITPRYEGLDLHLVNQPHGWTACYPHGAALALPLGGLASLISAATQRPARLVGYRGKERCELRQLQRYLADSTGPVTRTTLYLYPLSPDETGELLKPIESLNCRFIRSRFVSRQHLERDAKELATREGVEIHLLENDHLGNCFLWQPNDSATAVQPAIKLAKMNHADDWLLDIRTDRHQQFIVRQFDVNRFRRSARFLADAVIPPMEIPTAASPILTWRHAESTRLDKALLLDLGEEQGGELRIQTIRIDGRERYLVYRADPTAAPARRPS